ncbi:MAG TPA: caspase family protein [Streptosporangiaceae bacterium]|nr:caspase family protein [Streptosporangiaceae bacterium]
MSPPDQPERGTSPDLIAGSGGASGGDLSRPGSRVLLAGTGRHPAGSPLPAVPAVEASLADLAAALRERAGVCGPNLLALLNPASPLEFGRAVAKVAGEATDALVVYYAGHGLVGPDGGLYLATCATDDLADGLCYTALPYRALRQAVRDSRARTITMILDCCFAGRADVLPGPPVLDAVFEQAPVHGGFLLASTAREEQGLAIPGARHTAFTGALIGLLRDGDPAGPAQLTLDHVFRYLSRVLPGEGAPRPRRHSSDHAGELIMAPNPAYRARPVPEPGLARGGGDPESTDSAGDPDPESRPDTCPYRGLASFGPEDTRYFFGRRELVTELTRHIVADGGLIAVVGASGCGKTSLLRAGVVPALQALEPGWTVAAMTPGPRPAGTLRAYAAKLAGHEPAVLLVDQFEELFTAGAPEDERACFIRDLTSLATGSATVVIAVRADFYEACTRYPSVVRVLEDRQVIVSPMGPDDLRAAIEQPARVAGLRMESGLAETLLREARMRRHGEQCAVMPLLSHALLVTWQRRSGDLLTIAGYRATGGIDEAVAFTAEQAYATMDHADQPEVRHLLLRLIRLGDGVEDTRCKLPLAQLADPDRLDTAGRVLNALAAARLVTVDGDGVEITHEALLYAWPRLRGWIDEDRTALLAGQQLADAARAWQQAGRQETDLYRGPRLDIAAQTDPDYQASPLVREFLDCSQAERRRERNAGRRRARNRRATLAIVGVLVLLAAMVSAFAIRQQQDAAARAATVNSTDLAADAAGLRAAEPGLASQLATAAYHDAPTEEAVSQLYDTLDTPLDAVVGSTGSPVLRVSTQANGPLAIADDQNGTLRIWNLADPLSPILDATIRARKTAIALTPDGRWLTGPCPSGPGLCLWSLAQPRRPALTGRLPLPDSGLTLLQAAFSADGTMLAAVDGQGTTLLWSIANPEHPVLRTELASPTRNPQPNLAAVAFAPRGGLLASTVMGGTTRLWRLRGLSAPDLVATIPTGYQALAFNPDGTLLAAVAESNVGLWHIGGQSGPVSVNVMSFEAGTDLMAVAFSPDGSSLVYGGNDTADSQGQLCQLSMTPVNLGPDTQVPSCISTATGTFSMAYTPGGALFVGGLDGTVRLWSNPLPQVDGVDAGLANSVAWALSPDGRLLIAGVEPAQPQLDPPFTGIWDVPASGSAGLEGRLPSPQQVQFFGPAALLTLAQDDAVELWDLRDPHHPVLAATLGTGVAASSPGGGLAQAFTCYGDMVAVVDPGVLRLWKVSPSLGAVQVGSIPDTGTYPAGLVTARAVIRITPAGIDWWDISDAAEPVHVGLSPMANANSGNGASGADVFAASTPPESDSSGATVDLWSVADGRPQGPSVLSTSAGSAIGISPDGRLLAVTVADNATASLWNVSDPRHPQLAATIETQQRTTGISLAPDDDLMADWNNTTVQVWDIRDLTAPVLEASFTPPGQSIDIGPVIFSSAGSALMVFADSSAYLYDTSPAELAQRLCSYTGGSITAAQWRRYAPGVPPQALCP